MTTPIVAILGGGQLGRMIALAGYPLGVRCRSLDPDPLAPAGQVTEQIVARYDDESALRQLARGCDAATVEFENVPTFAARYLEAHAPFFPGPEALAAAQERLAEKWLFRSLDIPTPRFVAVESRATLERAAEHTGLPAILKTRRLGYDGKGQYVLRDPAAIDPAWEALGGVPLVLEEMIPFDREVSIIAVRSRAAHTAFYPLIENHHDAGILRLSLAPAPDLTPALQSQAEAYTLRVLDRLNYVGVLTIEFFVRNEQLIANEMACRVHNSGHWTIEGAECSQFENHLRAILGWPLGSTAPRACSAMVNLIGDIHHHDEILQTPGAHLHLYGKEPRPWRKLGHVTLTASNARTVTQAAERLRDRVTI
ncbi:MAG: 5-(carboxyamino)imidazole ribonucleotide synthase [Phycisphaerae bacterium]|nr:5-(carboxyamino)imidazole ribonucleotide synthase [Phycisphaerae bacterium]